MAYVRDLWFTSGRNGREKRKTKRHPDLGGSKQARRWLAVWIDPDGIEQTKAFRTEIAASKYARKKEHEVESGEYRSPATTDETVGALAAKWLELRAVGGGSRLRYESTYRLHIAPTFEQRRARSVKPSEVLAWLRDLSKTHGAMIQAHSLFILASVFDLAVADGMRRDNPAKAPIIPRPHSDPLERALWPASQVWDVVYAQPVRYQLVSVLQAGCGLRQGEAFGVALEDFDFGRGRLQVRRQLLRVGKQIVFKLPKGGREREVPLPLGVARLVQIYAETYPPEPYALPWMNEDGTVADKPHTCNLLFRWGSDRQRSAGRDLQHANFNKAVWKPALAAAGVISGPVHVDGRWWRWPEARGDGTHALRHYFSTALQNAGVPMVGVMEFMGHSRKRRDVPISVGVYGHVTEEMFEAARSAIDASLFRLRAVQDQPSDGTGTEQAL